MKEIIKAIETNNPRDRRMLSSSFASEEANPDFVTPPGTQNPEPPTSKAPLLPNNFTTDIPAVLPSEAPTPTPEGTTAPPLIALRS